MSDFDIFFPEGIKHITDLGGIDHILFVAALSARYLAGEWKKLLVLITAFTIGHSITLALSTLQIVNVPVALTEFLIAASIVVTAVLNFRHTPNRPGRLWLLYALALVFGLIHGLGFSTLLKNMLGTDQSIVWQLLAFNLGLEVGQLLIVAVLLLISFIFVRLLDVSRRDYVLVLSAGIAALALQMAIERFPYKSEEKNETTALQLHGPALYGVRGGTEHPQQPYLEPWKQV